MKNKNIFKIGLIVFILAIAILPFFSFAQTIPDSTGEAKPTLEKECGEVKNIGDILCRISFILNQIIPILLILGVIYFIWGVITYMIGSDEEAKKKGRNRVIYGIIGLVVIVGMWGIVAIIFNTFSLDKQDLTMIDGTNLTSQVETGSCSLKSNPILGDLINYVTCIIGKSVIPLIFVLAVAMFVLGVVQYVINADSEEKRTKGRQFMVWGIIALVVMVSVWGLVRIVGETFNIDTTFVPQVKD